MTNDMLYDQRMQRIAGSLAKVYKVTVLSQRKFAIKYSNDSYEVISYRPWLQSGIGFYAIMNAWFFMRLLFNSYDAICAVDLDSLWAASLVSKWRSKKLIYDAHEYYEETPELQNKPRIKRFWKNLAHRLIPKLRYCYTVNDPLAKEMSEVYGVPFNFIMNVPYLQQEIETVQHRKEKIILYQGVLNVGRGLEQMIEAMQYIDDAKLHLVGEGDIDQKLRSLVTDLKLKEKVVFLGRKSPAELKQLTAEAWLGINLLEASSKSYYLSLANKYFDYIHAGIPQLSMDFPVYSSLNEENEVAILLKDLEVHKLVRSVKELAKDEDRYNQLSSACAEAKRQYNWQAEEKKLLAFYRQALGD